MKKIKNYASKIILLLFVGLFVVVSCKRDLEDLEPAAFPKTPEVFIDGFSGGLEYAAFGGSKVTAFTVDTDVKYSGTTSMAFAVPDAGDPAGAFAGGAFFTGAGRDLTDYDALTFWARATQPANINEIGFGNDFGELKYIAVINDVPVNTNWQKYVIPIPDPSKLVEERGMLFYAEGPENDKGYTFWLDEVKFEKLGTIGQEQPYILEGQDQVITTQIGENLPIGGLHQISNLVNGVNQRVNAAPNYFTFTSSNPSVATVNELGVVTVLDQGEAVVTATLAGRDAIGSLTVQSTGQAVVPQSPAPAPTFAQSDVISMFSNAYANVLIDTWNTGWLGSTAVTQDLQVSGDDVKRYTNLNFVGIEFVSSQIDATSMNTFHIDIWTPSPTSGGQSFLVKLIDFGPDGAFGGGDDSEHEVGVTSPTLVSENWVSIDLPLSSFTGLSSRANLAQLVLSGDLPTVFVDNVYFHNQGGTTGGDTPTMGAPVPAESAADVISVFSDAYDNIAGTNFNPDWGQATAVSEVAIAGNNTLLYAGLNYQGTEFASAVDASGMTHLHIDYWTANSTELNAFTISTGPNETGIPLNVPTSGWGSADIPLSSFTDVDVSDIIQLKFDGNGDIYLDNIYFYKETVGGNTPTTGAPVPMTPAANVISIFSDTYMNVDGTNLNPDWGQATVTTEVNIAGNNTLLYSGLNYQGTELGTSQDVSGMTTLHIDYWTANSDDLKIFLISPGPVETLVQIPVPTAGWGSVDIPLSDFAPVDLTDVFQFKFEGNGDIYLDNIYFYN